MLYKTKHIIHLSALAALFLLMACSNIDDVRLVEAPVDLASAATTETSYVMPTLSLSVRIERVGLSSRADEENDTATPRSIRIGSGSQIDYIIYAVYDSEGNLLMQYADENKSELTIDDTTIKAAIGQNIIKWEGEYLNIELDSLPQGDYKLVCWAQSSKCHAYDTHDLKLVKVDYDGALNNDEARDAFCTSQPFSVYPDMPDEDMVVATLRRPFSQINVGTSGADYANNENIYGGVLYTYSSVSLSGVSNYINVVDDIIGPPMKDTVTFGFNKIAAYYNMDIPKTNADLIYSPDEEFLLVHLNDKTINDGNGDGFADFTTEYPTVEYNENSTQVSRYLTESFKYLSMCYVLVPTSGDANSTIDNIKVTFADNISGTGKRTSFSKSQLSVKRNYRTNIIGGLYAPPEDVPVDDPTTVFSCVTCNVAVITTYFNNFTTDNLPY